MSWGVPAQPHAVLTMLADTIVHTKDIRRALGMPRTIRAERLERVLDYAKGVGFPVGTKGRIRGLSLRATDVPWTTGDGPEVAGTGEALLMAMVGRRVALDELHGSGVEQLKTRQ